MYMESRIVVFGRGLIRSEPVDQVYLRNDVLNYGALEAQTRHYRSRFQVPGRCDWMPNGGLHWSVRTPGELLNSLDEPRAWV